MNLWKNYKTVVSDVFPDIEFVERHAEWTSDKGVNLTADLYKGDHIIKSRQIEIWDDKSCSIHNNIIYPKTGSNLPCFGMDLMGMSDKRVVIVFDFQHPVEKYLFYTPELPKSEGTYRFFEAGNHFSDNILVRYCKPDEVDEYLPLFEKYLRFYKNMLDETQPTGTDTSEYIDFDKYMIRLDPISGYLSNRFGKEEAHTLIKEFFFSYATHS